MAILDDTLGMELEPEAKEKAVGSFYADIVCKDFVSNIRVVVQNQIETTDYDHLRKLLTYAAGLEAAMVIWITKGFREEHRVSLDWLNKSTDESIRQAKLL